MMRTVELDNNKVAIVLRGGRQLTTRQIDFKIYIEIFLVFHVIALISLSTEEKMIQSFSRRAIISPVTNAVHLIESTERREVTRDKLLKDLIRKFNWSFEKHELVLPQLKQAAEKNTSQHGEVEMFGQSLRCAGGARERLTQED